MIFYFHLFPICHIHFFLTYVDVVFWIMFARFWIYYNYQSARMMLHPSIFTAWISACTDISIFQLPILIYFHLVTFFMLFYTKSLMLWLSSRTYIFFLCYLLLVVLIILFSGWLMSGAKDPKGGNGFIVLKTSHR